MTAMGNAVNVFTRFYHFQTTKYHEFIFIISNFAISTKHPPMTKFKFML